MVLNVTDLENESGVGDLRLPHGHFSCRNSGKQMPTWKGYYSCIISVSICLQVSVSKLNANCFVVHYASCSGERGFGGSKRNDWVCVRRHPGSDTAQPGTLNGHVPDRLDAVFNLTSRGIVYRLAYVTLLNWVGGTSLQGLEGMLRFGLATHEAGTVITIAKIEEIAHLIPLKPG